MNLIGKIFAATFVIAALSGCTAMKKMQVGMAENPYAGQPESILRGQAVYQAHCVRCHGEKGHGDGPDAVTLTSRPLDLTTSASENSANTAAMNITYGKGEMPPNVDLLSSQEIWDVSNYVISLTPPTPDPQN